MLFRWGRLSVSSKQGDMTLYQTAFLVLEGGRKRLAPLPGSRGSSRCVAWVRVSQLKRTDE